MGLIKRVATALDLDYAELQRIKDKKLVVVAPEAISGSVDDADDILGIDSSWSKQQVMTHLRTEFTKWNGRLSNLTSDVERANAQRMLELISIARKRYE